MSSFVGLTLPLSRAAPLRAGLRSGALAAATNARRGGSECGQRDARGILLRTRQRTGPRRLVRIVRPFFVLLRRPYWLGNIGWAMPQYRSQNRKNRDTGGKKKSWANEMDADTPAPNYAIEDRESDE